GAKMSKSLGNVVRLRDALERIDAQALRMFFLSTHYRNPLSFADRSLADAELRMEYFYDTLRKVEGRLTGRTLTPGCLLGDPERFAAQFRAAMDDDFNTAEAFSVISALFAAMNELCDKPPVKDRDQVLRTLFRLREVSLALGSVLGILDDAPAEWLLRR